MANTRVDDLSFDVEGLSHVVATRDFQPHTRPYDSTLVGEVHLFADDSEITEPNRLPAKFDLVDTVRAQYELLETLDEDGTYCDVPFCCTCSNRGCTSLQWDLTRDDDGVSLSMTDLGGERIGNSPYRLSWESLCTCVRDLCLTAVDFCAANDIEQFERADWVDASAPEYYGTRAELQRYADGIQTLLQG